MHISSRKLFFFTALIGLFLASAISANAQIRRIVGKVTDDKGQPVAGAKILFQGMDVVRNIDTKTDKRGEYSWILGIQGGTFRIIVHGPPNSNFKPAWREKVTPEVGEEKREDFKLEPGDDYKTPWEMTDQEKQELLKQGAEIEKRNKEIGAANNIIVNAKKFFEEKKYAEAIAELNKGVENFSKNESSAKNNQALSALNAFIGQCNVQLAGDPPNVNQDKLEEARKAYEAAIKFDPKNSDNMMNLGVVLSKMGKNKEAQEIFEKMESGTEKNPKALYNRAATMINSDQKPELIEPVLRKCIQSDPNFGECVYELGRILVGYGRPEPTKEGIDLLKKYLTIGKNKLNRETADEIIKALDAK
jgi:tetratricopeptide (TPR) repeat protein